MNDPVNKALEDTVKKMEDEADANVAAGTDEAHNKLVYGVEVLLEDAKMGLFHDFHTNGLAMPKVGFIQRLEALINNTKEGMYDN